MERALRRYIIRTLVVHLAFLLVAAAVVAYAGKSLYNSFESQAVSQAIDQARKPATQAADGILRHFGRVLDTLAVADPTSSAESAAEDVWLKVRDAASDLILLDIRNGQAVERRRFGNVADDSNLEEQPRPRELWRLLSAGGALPADVNRVALDSMARIERSSDGEESTTEGRAILGPVVLAEGAPPVMLLATKMRENLAGVAVVPTAYLDRAFLTLSREPGRLELLLAETGAGLVVTSTEATTQWPAGLTQFVNRRLSGESQAPVLVEGEPEVRGATFRGMIPAVVMTRGVDLSGSRRVPPDELAVVAVLNGESALGPLAAVSRTAILWAAAVIAIMTAILVSSSIQLIRGRNRLEGLRAEMVEQELRAARSIQLRWLPDDGIRHVADREVDVAAENLPASHISGDFYNYFELPGSEAAGGEVSRSRLALVVGDVTGHGMAAAFLMSTAQLLAESALRRDPDPGAALTRVNAQLSRQAHGGQFVTLLLAVLDADANEIRLASAGHAGPLVCDEAGRWKEAPVAGDLVAGVMEQVTYETTTIPLEGVRSLMLYTDGAVEAQNLLGDRFDLSRFAAGLSESLPGGATSARQAVPGGPSGGS